MRDSPNKAPLTSIYNSALFLFKVHSWVESTANTSVSIPYISNETIVKSDDS
ncbi:hypothetical protein BC643_3801 [Mangrovibacterium diazotrophicum]|uniref:Uncharacterized protein n=1 Tax=Mangrovibacterium diazotrophicum TaxID=1261403 RepID=A0A419VX98_9BACT|nr:hypothetical protein BC643_3801 [Mangrovibacterium diazotrophicum]